MAESTDTGVTPGPRPPEGKEHYDRDIFFDAVRQDPFSGSLTQQQVDGLNYLLQYWEPLPYTDRRWLAAGLGTQLHETAWTCTPIAEYGKGSGHDYGQPDPDYGGQCAYGRGYVQLTWSENYQRADDELVLNNRLTNNFDLALDPSIAAEVLFVGCAAGWFTGKKYSDYFNDSITDWYNSRRIVNGTDQATMIAGYKEAFYNALTAAATTEEPPQEEHPPAVPPVKVCPTCGQEIA